MTARNMIVLMFTFIAVISPSVHGSLQITNHEFPLMHYTKLISEEHFTAGPPLVVVLPLAEVFSSKHFQCHNKYYISRTVSVCKHTAALCTATSILLLLGVLQCCDQHSVPGVPHHVPYRNRISGTYQNPRGNFKLQTNFGFFAINVPHWH